eukprot:TRINITY_DN517_c2_g2_i1.p1 TRINITY_DN517_c2_g2~~TRINITY_DN517_c2_g2_i1.p1  ORF type:complete len:150 (+),score=24.48 TRINITY_DN517_c2_g2_i1:47-496(+)
MPASSQKSVPRPVGRKPAKPEKMTKASKIKQAKDAVKVTRLRKTKQYTSYTRYVHKLVRSIENKAGKTRITAKGMGIMDSLIHDLFDRLACEAGRLATHANMATMSSRAIMAAVKLHYPKELASHALAAGAAAVGNYEQAKRGRGKKRK